MAKILGGKITLESELDKGSSFNLHLPYILNDKVDNKIENKVEIVEAEVIRNIEVEDDIELGKEIKQKAFNDEYKHILIVEDDITTQFAIESLIQDKHIKIETTEYGKDAINKIQSNHFDCVILDLSLIDMTGFEILNILENKKCKMPPIIIYTGRELKKKEEDELMRNCVKIVLKSGKSKNRLLDETSLILNKFANNNKENINSIPSVENSEIFKGMKVLLVDDDIRNLYSLSTVLSKKGMVISKAEDGLQAVQILEIEEFDIVLMDIMMPVLDGYETMKKIRSEKRFENLPIVALTAKAMAEDKAKCIAAGATDYLAKPVDIDKLLALMKVLGNNS